MKTLCLIVATVGLLVSGWILAPAAQEPDTLAQFQHFLEESLHKQPTAQEATIVSQRAATFWKDHLKDYIAHPSRYRSLMTIYHEVLDSYRRGGALPDDPARYKTRIDAFTHWDSKNTPPKRAILFVGSSSAARWPTAVAFASYPVINRGIGGFSLRDLNYFYNDLVRKYAPAVIVIYCDIDVYLGNDPTTALKRFEALSGRIERDLPKTAVLFISIKPTPTDDLYGNNVRRNGVKTNGLIKQFIATQHNMRFVDVTTSMLRDGKLRSGIFQPDGMHLNAEGYRLWNSVVAKPLTDLYAQSTATLHARPTYHRTARSGERSPRMVCASPGR